jgi:hypothetical protein
MVRKKTKVINDGALLNNENVLSFTKALNELKALQGGRHGNLRTMWKRAQIEALKGR